MTGRRLGDRSVAEVDQPIDDERLEKKEPSKDDCSSVVVVAVVVAVPAVFAVVAVVIVERGPSTSSGGSRAGWGRVGDEESAWRISSTSKGVSTRSRTEQALS